MYPPHDPRQAATRAMMSSGSIIESLQAGVVFVVLENGEKLLESIRAAAHQTDLHSGVLLSGIGSLQKGRIHTVASNELPTKEDFYDLPGPLEITNYTGIIAAYEPHVHIPLMDSSGHLYGGHLEEGCEVLTLAKFSIPRAPDVRLARRKELGKLFPLLTEE